MSTYRSLKSIFHEKTEADALAERDRRLAGYATYSPDFMVGEHRLFYMATADIISLSHRILTREREIETLVRALPEAANISLIAELTTRGIISTDTMEGVRTTRKMITDALEYEKPEGKRLREFTHLLKAANNRDATVQTPQKVREIYDHIMEGQLEAGNTPDGELFRTGEVHISDNSSKPVHSGVMPEQAITQNMEVLLAHTADPAVPPLFSSIMAHFMFEHTHPFYDGNGRMGRYLLGVHLAKDFSRHTILTLLTAINLKRTKYYKSFEKVQNPHNYGEATEFLQELLGIVEDAQENIMRELDKAIKLLAELHQIISEIKKEYHKTYNILYVLGQMHLFTDPFGANLEYVAQEITHTSKETARTRLRELEDAGLIQSRKVRRTLHWRLTEAGAKLLHLEPHRENEES